MRKVIVNNIMSLDGYYEGPGRNVMIMNMDEAFDAYNLERIQAAGTVCSVEPHSRDSAPTGPASPMLPTIPATALSVPTTVS
jgi:hypothetical protein